MDYPLSLPAASNPTISTIFNLSLPAASDLTLPLVSNAALPRYLLDDDYKVSLLQLNLSWQLLLGR